MKNLFKNSNKTFIIAKIDVNHNNNISLVRKLIRNAKLAKADAVKFNLIF
jgi:sialic acid synthase SpsE